ncbi:MAG: CARDB domain-containing protein, partial [Thermoplasmata archaeon]
MRIQASKRVLVYLLAFTIILSYFVSIVPKTDAQVTALSNDTPSLNYILTYKDFSFTAYGNYYTVVASRSTDSWTESPSDYDISVYNDVSMTQLVNESSMFPIVDAVVINREGLSTTTMYAEVTWYSGSGVYAIVEAEYNTTTLPRNSTVSEYFETNEIVDEWDHYVYGGRTYEIELTEVPTGANYNIYLFTQDGAIGNGFTGEVGYAAKGNQSTPIIYTASVSKWVCVLVTNENNVTGPYKVTSRDIELQKDSPRIGSLNSANKNDRYKFDANTNEYTAVALLASSSSNDYDLKVYNNLDLTGEVLSSTMISGYPDICVFDRIGLSTATYYALADRWSGAGSYTIEKDGKRSIAIGTVYSETMNTTELIDTFQIQLNAGTQYKISIPSAPAGANYEIYLFNSTGRIYQAVQSSGFVGKGSISTPITYTPQTTKDYCIVVTNLNAIYGAYSLLVEVIPSEPVQVLSNNAPMTGTFDDSNTYDVFRFTVNPQSYTTIALRPPQGQDFDLAIYSDASLTNLITSSSRGSGLIDACIFNGYTLSSSVTYYAKAYRYGSSSGQYTIEADSRDYLIMGNYTSRTMGTNNVVETFWINLTAGEEYIINFPPPNAAPEGAEYWFYAFSGNSTISAALASSHYNSGMYFKASVTGAHAFVILNLFNATGQAPTGDYKFRVRQIYRLYDDIPQIYSLNSVTHIYDEFNFTVWKNTYSVVAIKPLSSSSNYNLKVYSNLWLDDSSLVGESALSSNLVDAYVMNGFSEASTRAYYALASRSAGTGDYIVESDSEWNLTIGTTYDSYMGSGTIVDIYWCYLTAGLEYIVSLPTIPAGATFKLYAFGDSGPISSAIVPTTSTENSITFTPTVTKHYGILVISESVTSGSFQIRVALNNAPDFSISASPTTQAVYAGSSTQYTISLTSHNGFSSPVTLSIPWLPAGCSYSFSPSSPITPTASTTLTITTSTSTPIGTYNNITVRAVSGTLEHTVTLTLIVNTPPVNPDIKPWSLWFYPTAWAIATIPTTINVSVANIGGQAVTSSFSVALLVGGNTVQTWTVPSLGIGQRANLTTTYTFPSPGTQTIEVRCDTGNVITESNETNNNQIYNAYIAEIAVSGSTYTGSMSAA